MDNFKTLETLLRNRKAILEFIKDDMPQSNDVKELIGVVKLFYTRLILEECRHLALDTDNFTQKDADDDFEEIDYD